MKINWSILFRRVLFLIAIIFVALTVPNWAQATLYIFLGTMYFFREEIGKLLLRLKSVTRDGVDTYHPQEQQIAEAASGSILDISKNTAIIDGKNLNQNKIDAIENFGKDYSVVEGQILEIEKELKNYPKLDGEKINILTRHVAVLQFFLWCESIYEPMFGSQIQLLKMLLDAPRKASEVSDYFAGVRQNFPNSYKDWDVNRYMTFLSASNIVYLDAAFNYQLTEKGKDFLRWLISSNKNLKIGNL